MEWIWLAGIWIIVAMFGAALFHAVIAIRDSEQIFDDNDGND